MNPVFWYQNSTRNREMPRKMVLKWYQKQGEIVPNGRRNVPISARSLPVGTISEYINNGNRGSERAPIGSVDHKKSDALSLSLSLYSTVLYGTVQYHEIKTGLHGTEGGFR